MSACSQLNVAATAKGTAENPYVVTQGITFSLVNRVKKSVENGGGAFDLTGFTGRAQLRSNPEDVGTSIADFTVTIRVPATQGIADVVLPPSLSVNIEPGMYVFDIEYVDGGDPENIISGTNGAIYYIHVKPGVTKP